MEWRLQNLHMKFNFQFVFSIGIHKYIQTWMLNVWIALHNKLCSRNTAKWDDALRRNVITPSSQYSLRLVVLVQQGKERSKSFAWKFGTSFFAQSPWENWLWHHQKGWESYFYLSENFIYFFFAVSHLRHLLSFINKESLWPSLRKHI